METTEGNKLIAEFMGATLMGKTAGWEFNMFGSVYSNCYHNLKFHSSWDWLIPVIDKITDTDEYQVFKDERCTMFSDGSIYINTKYIDTTWIQVIEFIEWYNKQK